MAAPSVLYIDDRDPLIHYTPSTNWGRGGNASDYQSTSTSTTVAGSSASITFSGTGISVWATVQILTLGQPLFVLTSYSIDGEPATSSNMTELPIFQFQQKFFQSGLLAPTSHTLVVTLDNPATFFLDYFLVIPLASESARGTASLPTPPTPAASPPFSSFTHSTTPTVSSDPAVIDNSRSSSNIPIGAIVGGSLGGLALLGLAILAVWFGYRRGKGSYHRSVLPYPNNLPFNPTLATEQHRPRDAPPGPGPLSHFPYPSPSSSAPGIIPPSKTMPLPALPLSVASQSQRGPVENPSDSYTLSGIGPPRYDG